MTTLLHGPNTESNCYLVEVLFYIWAKLERLVQFLARQPHLSIRSDEKWCFLQSKNENTEEKGSEINFNVYEIIEFVEKKSVKEVFIRFTCWSYFHESRCISSPFFNTYKGTRNGFTFNKDKNICASENIERFFFVFLPGNKR